MVAEESPRKKRQTEPPAKLVAADVVIALRPQSNTLLASHLPVGTLCSR